MRGTSRGFIMVSSWRYYGLYWLLVGRGVVRGGRPLKVSGNGKTNAPSPIMTAQGRARLHPLAQTLSLQHTSRVRVCADFAGAPVGGVLRLAMLVFHPLVHLNRPAKAQALKVHLQEGAECMSLINWYFSTVRL